MEQTQLFYRFGAALLIGFLVGLQREYAYSESGKKSKDLFAGERTYALIALAGCTAGLLADELASPWPFVVTLGLIGLLITVSYAISAWRGSLGMTTEAAALVTTLAGALCYWDYVALAAALGVATTVLLSLKLETDRLVQRLTRQDIAATLKFAVITAIVLPLLPDQTYGPPPLDVLNPVTSG